LVLLEKSTIPKGFVLAPRSYRIASGAERSHSVAGEFDIHCGRCVGVETIELTDEWPKFRELCTTRNFSGNDIPDAWLAATALFRDEEIATFDLALKRMLPVGRVTILK
jgi:predicted nucleic acid-binding protein